MASLLQKVMDSCKNASESIPENNKRQAFDDTCKSLFNTGQILAAMVGTMAAAVIIPEVKTQIQYGSKATEDATGRVMNSAK